MLSLSHKAFTLFHHLGHANEISWVLVDPFNVVSSGSQSPIMADGIPFPVDYKIEGPSDKDSSVIVFSMNVPQEHSCDYQCIPQWSTAANSTCENDIGCVTAINWQLQSDGGFYKVLMCEFSAPTPAPKGKMRKRHHRRDGCIAL